MNQVLDLGHYFELRSGQSRARILKKGNNLFSLKNDGEPNWMYFPFVPERPESPLLAGNPFLFPWANRLQSDGFSFQGRFYPVQPLLRDGRGLPLHGLVLDQVWTQFSDQTPDYARLDSRVIWNESHPGFASFPFEQEISISHILTPGCLQIRTVIKNTGNVPLPVSFGFHPYFLCDVEREAVRIGLPDARYLKLDERLLPLDATTPVLEPWLALPELLDTGLTQMSPDAVFVLRAAERELRLELGEGFSTFWLYSPAGPHCDFVCLEPMVAPANALCLERTPVTHPGQSYLAAFRIQF
ncbi:MAG: aldose 1-epimerase [Spirochaetales bacterium]|nr:aldose 1-epimerase [Spirochaetales bacterium]